MKTDFSSDASKTYSHMDVVLVRKTGFWPWLERLFTNDRWNECYIVFNINSVPILCGIDRITGNFAPLFYMPKWKGLITARNLKCKIVNIPYPPHAEKSCEAALYSYAPNMLYIISRVFEKFGDLSLNGIEEMGVSSGLSM